MVSLEKLALIFFKALLALLAGGKHRHLVRPPLNLGGGEQLLHRHHAVGGYVPGHVGDAKAALPENIPDLVLPMEGIAVGQCLGASGLVSGHTPALRQKPRMTAVKLSCPRACAAST